MTPPPTAAAKTTTTTTTSTTTTAPIVARPPANARMTGTVVFLLCTTWCAHALVSPSSKSRAFVRRYPGSTARPTSTIPIKIRHSWSIPEHQQYWEKATPWSSSSSLASSTSSSWNAPSYSNHTDHSSSNDHNSKEAALAEQDQTEKEKKAMIRKLLSGYNAKTASALKNSEIKRQTLFWSTESGVAGQYFGDEVYHDVLGVSISRATTMMDCFADMWQFINDIILDYKEVEFLECTNENEEQVLTAQHRWALWRKDGDDRPLEGSKHAYFCVFAQCSDAYDYKAFTALVAALECCRELCVHMGNEFTVTLFHPKFKNSHALLSPERHSPFPTIALQFGPAFKAEEEIAAETSIFTRKKRQTSSEQLHEKVESRTNTDDKTVSATADEDDDEEEEPGTINGSDQSSATTPADDEFEQVFTDLVEGHIDDLDYTRSRLEVLYNTAAASGLYDAVWTHPSFDYDDFDEQSTNTQPTSQSKFRSRPASSFGAPIPRYTSDEELLWLTAEEEGVDLPLVKSFKQEHRRRHKNVPVKCVRQYSSDWAIGARRVQGKVNPALLYWDSIINDENQPDGWVICQENLPEHVYASLWNTIKELYAIGRRADQEATNMQTSSFVTGADTTPDDQRRVGGGSRFNLAAWQNSLSKANAAAQHNHQNNNSNNNHSNNVVQQEIISSKEAEEILGISPKEVRSCLFVTTKFMPYNAEGFKRFAITVNAALKRFTDKRMFLEVFHPEYVGSKGYRHDLRRAPFPMIQICYHVRPTSTNNSSKDFHP